MAKCSEEWQMTSPRRLHLSVLKQEFHDFQKVLHTNQDGSWRHELQQYHMRRIEPRNLAPSRHASILDQLETISKQFVVTAA